MYDNDLDVSIHARVDSLDDALADIRDRSIGISNALLTFTHNADRIHDVLSDSIEQVSGDIRDVESRLVNFGVRMHALETSVELATSQIDTLRTNLRLSTDRGPRSATS